MSKRLKIKSHDQDESTNDDFELHSQKSQDDEQEGVLKFNNLSSEESSEFVIGLKDNQGFKINSNLDKDHQAELLSYEGTDFKDIEEIVTRKHSGLYRLIENPESLLSIGKKIIHLQENKNKIFALSSIGKKEAKSIETIICLAAYVERFGNLKILVIHQNDFNFLNSSIKFEEKEKLPGPDFEINYKQISSNILTIDWPTLKNALNIENMIEEIKKLKEEFDIIFFELPTLKDQKREIDYFHQCHIETDCMIFNLIKGETRQKKLNDSINYFKKFDISHYLTILRK